MGKSLVLLGSCFLLVGSSMLLTGCAVAGFALSGIQNRDRPGVPIQVFSILPRTPQCIPANPDSVQDIFRPIKSRYQAFRPNTRTMGFHDPHEDGLDRIEAARFRQRRYLDWFEFSVCLALDLATADIPDPVQTDSVRPSY